MENDEKCNGCRREFICLLDGDFRRYCVKMNYVWYKKIMVKKGGGGRVVG